MNSFKSLDKLVEQISFYINQLNSGKLSATQIDDLLAEVGQLQERLIILRYKAFEEGNTSTPEITEKKDEATAIETPIAFSINAPTVNQVSLIDAIEEAEHVEPKAEEVGEEPVAEVITEDLPVETIREITPEPEPETVVETVSIPEPAMEIPSLVAEPVNEGGYYAQKAAVMEEVTLAERLQKSPIGDLGKAIPLADKFVFINELFKQNTDDYHTSIDQLNKFDDLEEAFAFVKHQLMPLYGWNQDDKNVEKFMNLVERRYL